MSCSPPRPRPPVARVLRPGCVASAALPGGAEAIEADVTRPGSLAVARRGRRVDAVISCFATLSGDPDDAWAVEHRAQSHLLDTAVQVAFRPGRSRARRQALPGVPRWQPHCLKNRSPTTIWRPSSAPASGTRRGTTASCRSAGPATRSSRSLRQSALRSARSRAAHPPGFPWPHRGDRRHARSRGACRSGDAGQGQVRANRSYHATKSTLVWDAATRRHDAAATPSLGSRTRRDHCAPILAATLFPGWESTRSSERNRGTARAIPGRPVQARM